MSKYFKNIDKINELPDLSYEGYVWMSNETEPRKISSKSQILTGEQNPFIVEGFLKSSDGNVSVSLVSMNGLLKIYQYDLSLIKTLPKGQITVSRYLTHRFDDGAKIKFITVWLPVPDQHQLCEGMEVLCPKMRVFDGFEFKN